MNLSQKDFKKLQQQNTDLEAENNELRDQNKFLHNNINFFKLMLVIAWEVMNNQTKELSQKAVYIQTEFANKKKELEEMKNELHQEFEKELQEWKEYYTQTELANKKKEIEEMKIELIQQFEKEQQEWKLLQ
jgi:hypothetical protein